MSRDAVFFMFGAAVLIGGAALVLRPSGLSVPCCIAQDGEEVAFKMERRMWQPPISGKAFTISSAATSNTITVAMPACATNSLVYTTGSTSAYSCVGHSR